MRRSSEDIAAFRAQELLVRRASEGLDREEERELDQLDGSSITSFDLAAAMIDVAMRPVEVMPDAVREAVLATALSALQKPAAPPTAPALPAIAASLTLRAVPEVVRGARPAARPFRQLVLGGALAAAVIAGLLLGRLSAPSPSPAPAIGRLLEPDVAGDEIGVACIGADGVSGWIRWSTARQRGVLELHGSRSNDPRRARLQLWIVDRDRDPRYPVDGGMFDVSGPDTSFAFQTRVRVGTPREFLITREAAGGAVVSDRTDIVARGAVP